MLTGVEDASLEDKQFFSSSRPASSTPGGATLKNLPASSTPATGVDEVGQPVEAGRGRF